MDQYDIAIKRLAGQFTEDYVRFALGVEKFLAEQLQVREVDKELPALLREVDFAARVTVEEEEFVLLIEFQTFYRPDMPKRMLAYSWRLHERYKLPVYPVLIVLKEGGGLQDELRMEVLGKEIHRFRFVLIPIWEVDAQKVITQRLKGLYPLLPLMKWREKTETVLEKTQSLIVEEIAVEEQRADAYAALALFSAIKYPQDIIRAILRREIMIESPFYREILREGEEIGFRKGHQIGREEGQLEALRNSVLDVLEVRFGSVPAELEEQMKDVKSARTLQSLLRRAIVVSNLEEFKGLIENFQKK